MRVFYFFLGRFSGGRLDLDTQTKILVVNKNLKLYNTFFWSNKF